MKEIWGPDPRLKKVLPEKPLPEKPVWRLSRYALPFGAGGRSCVFNLLTRQCLDLEGLVLPEGTVPGDAMAGDPALAALARGRFLVPADADEAAVYAGVVRLLRAYYRKKRLSSFTILPTMACNARCVYCYEAGAQPIAMTPETEDATLRFILENRDPSARLTLAWFGGEPLLGRAFIDRVCAALDEAGADYRGSMVTNGSLVTGAVADRMAGPWRIRRVQVSMDGNEASYIRQKAYPRYDGQYRRVLEGIRMLAERGIRVNVRCNVCPENLAGLDEFIGDLAGALPARENVSVYFSPLFDLQKGGDSAAMWEACLAAEARLEAAGLRNGRRSGVRRLRLSFCMAENPFGSVVITPDGLLYNCEHCVPGTAHGNVWEGVTDRAALDSFALPEPVPGRCRECAFLPECTTFTRCPVAKNACREVRRMQLLRALERNVIEIDRRTAEDAAEEQDC